MKKISSKCSNCSEQSLNNISLDCGHSLCIDCLESFLLAEQKQEQLNDFLDIQCPSCSYETSLSIALVYKIVRPYRQHTNDYYKNGKSMVCMNCMNQCFLIDQYIQGKHAKHEVLPIDQAHLRIRETLGYEEKQLQETVHRLYFQIQKYTHCKSLINDISNANIMKIKNAFENLKEQLIKKQMEMLGEYEEIIYQKFTKIDQHIDLNRRNIQICKAHLQWIYTNLDAVCKPNKSLQVINYFINNHQKINNLTNLNSTNSITDLLEEIRQNKKIIQPQTFKQITQIIRQINIINYGDQSTLDSSQSLNNVYFENKRKDVLNTRNLQTSKIQNNTYSKSMKGQATLKKVASLKCKFLHF